MTIEKFYERKIDQTEKEYLYNQYKSGYCFDCKNLKAYAVECGAVESTIRTHIGCLFNHCGFYDKQGKLHIIMCVK